MITPSIAQPKLPERQVTFGRLGAASKRVFEAAEGEVDVAGKKQPRISTTLTVSTGAFGTESFFFGITSSMRVYHEASGSFATVESFSDLPAVPDRLKRLLHEDSLWKDAKNRVQSICEAEIRGRMSWLKGLFERPRILDLGPFVRPGMLTEPRNEQEAEVQRFLKALAGCREYLKDLARENWEDLVRDPHQTRNVLENRHTLYMRLLTECIGIQLRRTRSR